MQASKVAKIMQMMKILQLIVCRVNGVWDDTIEKAIILDERYFRSDLHLLSFVLPRFTRWNNLLLSAGQKWRFSEHGCKNCSKKSWFNFIVYFTLYPQGYHTVHWVKVNDLENVSLRLRSQRISILDISQHKRQEEVGMWAESGPEVCQGEVFEQKKIM